MMTRRNCAIYSNEQQDEDSWERERIKNVHHGWTRLSFTLFLKSFSLLSLQENICGLRDEKSLHLVLIYNATFLNNVGLLFSA